MTAERDDSRLRGTLFMPCVLDRLVDQNPEMRKEAFSRGISVVELRRSVLENLSLILNSRSHPQTEAWAGDEEIGRSVLGFGLPDFCGTQHDHVRCERLRREIERQIRAFEPRISPDSLSVSFTGGGACDGGTLELEIRGSISVKPLKDEIVFRAKLNLESGLSEIAGTN